VVVHLTRIERRVKFKAPAPRLTSVTFFRPSGVLSTVTNQSLDLAINFTLQHVIDSFSMFTPTIAKIIAMSALLSRGVVVPFQASPSIAANISFVLETANQTIHANSSHDAAATFPIGIGDPRISTIYSNWPVIISSRRC